MEARDRRGRGRARQPRRSPGRSGPGRRPDPRTHRLSQVADVAAEDRPGAVRLHRGGDRAARSVPQGRGEGGLSVHQLLPPGRGPRRGGGRRTGASACSPVRGGAATSDSPGGPHSRQGESGLMPPNEGQATLAPRKPSSAFSALLARFSRKPGRRRQGHGGDHGKHFDRPLPRVLVNLFRAPGPAPGARLRGPAPASGRPRRPAGPGVRPAPASGRAWRPPEAADVGEPR